MAHVEEDRKLAPKALLRGLLLLIAATLAIATWARVTDAPLAATPDMSAPVEAERLLLIHGQMNGAATVLDLNGAVIARLDPQSGGFVAGMRRALDQVRGRHGVDPGLPVRLIRFEGGRLALVDDHTGWRAELIGFGRDNFTAFSQLLN